MCKSCGVAQQRPSHVLPKCNVQGRQHQARSLCASSICSLRPHQPSGGRDFVQAPRQTGSSSSHVPRATEQSMPSTSVSTEARDDDVGLTLRYIRLEYGHLVLLQCVYRSKVALQVLPDSFSEALEHAAAATHEAIVGGANRCLVSSAACKVLLHVEVHLHCMCLKSLKLLCMGVHHSALL